MKNLFVPICDPPHRRFEGTSMSRAGHGASDPPRRRFESEQSLVGFGRERDPPHRRFEGTQTPGPDRCSAIRRTGGLKSAKSRVGAPGL